MFIMITLPYNGLHKFCAQPAPGSKNKISKSAIAARRICRPFRIRLVRVKETVETTVI